MLLDRIFSSKSRVLILREIVHTPEGISNSQLAERTGLSEMAVSRNIKDLVKSNLITTKSLGRNIISTINVESNISKSLKELFEWEKEIYNELSIIVKEHLILEYSKNNLLSIIIFGSRARGTEKLESDLDIMVLLKKGDKKTRTKFIEGVLVSIFELSGDEFLHMTKEYNPLISNIILQGEAIYGKKEFKDIIKKAGF